MAHPVFILMSRGTCEKACCSPAFEFTLDIYISYRVLRYR